MEFWLFAGPLLGECPGSLDLVRPSIHLTPFPSTGWYRGCSVIPYTSDFDLSTWAKYAQADPFLVRRFRQKASSFKLRLVLRFGVPSDNLEVSFYVTPDEYFKTDLFFTYPMNATHQAIAVHDRPKWTYASYPRFDLCSVDYLGYKMLAPCTTKQVIETGKMRLVVIYAVVHSLMPLSLVPEFGSNWCTPVEDWSYATSPYNLEKWRPFTSNGTQFEHFSD